MSQWSVWLTGCRCPIGGAGAHGHRCFMGKGAYRCGYPMDMSVPWMWVLTDLGVSYHECPQHEHPWPWLLGSFPQEHFNYYSLDPALGHLVFSIKYDEQEHLHLLLR